MRERVHWTASDAIPDRAAVLRLQGISPEIQVPDRIQALLDAALERYAALAEPRALISAISRDAFTHVYAGDGRNARETPLEPIYRRAEGLALMAATVGSAVTNAISDLFARHDVALGCMLDAVASASADHLADLLAERYRAMQPKPAAVRVLAYSPGYCGWHVSGQRALFRSLEPEEIGIHLNSSCLMQPLKSVSGVLVSGPAEIHRFRPTFQFCNACQDKQCRPRMASLPRH